MFTTDAQNNWKNSSEDWDIPLKIIEHFNILMEHQFGFRHHHSIIQMCHWIVNTYHPLLSRIGYSSGVFQVFRRANLWYELGTGFFHCKLSEWHPALTLQSYPTSMAAIFKSELTHRSLVCLAKEGVPSHSLC